MIVKTSQAQQRKFNGVAFDLLAVGALSMVTKMRYASGNRVPEHSHPNEQSGYVITGVYRLRFANCDEILGPGDSYSIPADVIHSLDVLEPGEVVDVFTPPRADYLDQIGRESSDTERILQGLPSADDVGGAKVTEFDITYRGTIYPWQCDHMGHMNVMWYSGKFDEASWQLLSKLGFTRAHFREFGTGMAAVEQHITYKRELYAGDVVTIRSRVLEIKEKSIQMMHEITNDETGEIAAASVITGVYIDVTRRKARLLPSALRERSLEFSSNCVVEGNQ